MVALNKIENIAFINNSIIININGSDVIIPLKKLSNKLKNATHIVKSMYNISPLGSGIDWPLINEVLIAISIIKDFG